MLVLSEEERHPAAGPDAADSDYLAGEIDKPVAVKEMSPVFGQGLPVSVQRSANAVFDSLGFDSGHELGGRYEQWRIALEPDLVTFEAGQLVEGLEVVLALGLGR